MRRSFLPAICAVILSLVAPALADTLVSEVDAKRIGLRRYWGLELPLAPGEAVTRMTLLEDELFVMTSANRALAVHAPTGILRWSRLVAEEGQTVRGPSLTGNYVFFTTPASVRALARRTGEVLGEPRELRGVITEVVSDVATLSIGEEHGVRLEDILGVYRVGEDGDIQGDAIATVRITSLRARMCKGKLVRMDSSFKAEPGNRVMAKVELPKPQITLPFAASSAAVADDKHIYGGLANQRFFCIDILSGSMVWELMAPHTVTAMPVLSGKDLFFAGQDGMVTSCTKDERVKNWTFTTEAPVFDSPVVGKTHVFVASSDRSVYCLDRATGKRLWRERFENPLLASPSLAGDRVYQVVPQEGLFVLDAKTGKQLWRKTDGGRYVAEFGADAYLFRDGAGNLSRVDAATGNERGSISLAAQFHVGSAADALMLFADAAGQLVCLRPADAPPMHPDQLADAFRDELKAARLAEAAAAPKPVATAEPGEPGKLSSLLFEDDFLASRSTAMPVGGKSSVTAKAQEAGSVKKPAEPKPAAKAKPAKKTESDAASVEESTEEDTEEPADASAPADEGEPEEGATEDAGESEDSSEEEASSDEAEATDEDSGEEATTQESDEAESEDGDADKSDSEGEDGGEEKGDDKGEEKGKDKPGAKGGE